MDSTKTAFKLREQLSAFLGIFSARFSRPAGKFVGQMVYGIQAAKDVLLSQIGRELGEPISIGKVENRLSRNLAREGLADTLHDSLLEHAARHIRKDTLVILDPSDIQKEYAECMPYLAKVWDGSKGKVGNNLGYSGCMAIACESGARRMTPLAFRLWSSKAPDFLSENHEVETLSDKIEEKAPGRGIRVYDRGGDRIGLFRHFQEKGQRFIVRLVGNRHLAWHGRKLPAEKLARKCRILWQARLSFKSHGRETAVDIGFGGMEVRLPDRPGEVLRLVVVRGFGRAPMMLLTNLAGGNGREDLWRVVEGYVTRWRVEEAIRCIKQSYRLENMRLLDYGRLKNMAALVAVAAHFAAAWMGMGERLAILRGHILDMAQRIHEVPEFFYYALADGIGRLLQRHGKGWGRTSGIPPPPDPQLRLPFDFA